MYIYRKRHQKKIRTRSARKTAKLKIKNRKRKLRVSGLKH